ncbi:MAG TPA: methyltransferase, partial [Myxococcota bacterium]|nr:methyltransferase [Myxococcota bacterium]
WDEVDPGSLLLASTVPRALGTRVAELGCGWGWLARALLDRCEGLAELHLIEADHRALDLARRNLDGAPVRLWWADATSERPVADLDAVVVNPPFHLAGLASPEVGIAMLQHAASLLRPGGTLWAVANVHLPYERPLRERYARVEIAAERAGFKVLRATKAEVAPPAPRPARGPTDGAARRGTRRTR